MLSRNLTAATDFDASCSDSTMLSNDIIPYRTFSQAHLNQIYFLKWISKEEYTKKILWHNLILN